MKKIKKIEVDKLFDRLDQVKEEYESSKDVDFNNMDIDFENDRKNDIYEAGFLDGIQEAKNQIVHILHEIRDQEGKK